MKIEYFRQFGLWALATICVLSSNVNAADQLTKFIVPMIGKFHGIITKSIANNGIKAIH